MPTSTQLSSDQLRQALQLSEQIESLQQRLSSILGGSSAATTSSGTTKGGGSPLKGRKMSPATLRKMRAAQQARWAKIKGPNAKPGGAAKSAVSTQKKRGGGMTPAQRAKISAALKARWAAKRKNDTATSSTGAAPK